MPTQVTTKKTETLDDDDEEAIQSTPLFDRSVNKKTKTIDKLSVRRTDPPEGHLGIIGPDATEREISDKWGGGEFDIKAKNAANQVVTQMTLKIAGDPIFMSDIEEARWRRANGLAPKIRGDAGSGIKDMLALYEDREAKRREEERERRIEERREASEREERMRREQREHEEKLQREIREADERRRKDEADREDRRLKSQREDDERRQRQHREDLERVEASNKAQLAQTQQFFQQLATMAKDNKGEAGGGAATAIKTLMTGMDLALKMRPAGDGGDAAPQDALTAIMSRLPETLHEARETAKAVYREITDGKKPPIDVNAAPNPRRGKGAAAVDESKVVITGATADRFKHMIGVLKKQKKDPETVLNQLAEYVIRESVGAPKAAPEGPPPGRAPRARRAPQRSKPRPAARAARPPRRAPRSPTKPKAAKASGGRVIPIKRPA